jgi:hypothetical protein
MPYWLYGRDAATGQPAEPFFSATASEEAARAEATAEGLFVEEVEFVPQRPESPQLPVTEATSQPRSTADHSVAERLVLIFRWLAVVCGLLGLVAVLTSLDLLRRGAWNGGIVMVVLGTVVTVAFLLAVAEGLRLGIAIERNTRRREHLGGRDRARQKSQ